MAATTSAAATYPGSGRRSVARMQVSVRCAIRSHAGNLLHRGDANSTNDSNPRLEDCPRKQKSAVRLRVCARRDGAATAALDDFGRLQYHAKAEEPSGYA